MKYINCVAHYIRYCMLVTALVWVVPFTAAAAVRVAVLPFDINAQEDLGYLKQAIPEMLSTRLESRGDVTTVEKPLLQQHLARLSGKKITEETARRLGSEMGADFVILGSLTKIGKQASLDTALINTREQMPVQRFSNTAEDMGSLPAKLNELARSLYFKILGKQVVSKILITGNKYIEQDAIMLSIFTKSGDVFSPERLQEDLKRIYQMGYFEDVKVASADGPGGKEITFQVVERPTVKEIQIQGNKTVKLEDIQKVMETKLRTVLDLNKVTGDVTRIRKAYTDKGFYNVSVYYKLKPISSEETGVIFNIAEGKVTKVKKITFSGNKSIPGKQLKKVMATREKNILSFITTAGMYKDDDLEKDVDRITGYYYSQGYLQAKVDKPAVDFKEDAIYINFTIFEGNRFVIGSIDVRGDLIRDKAVLMATIKSTPGKVFSSNILNEDLIAIKGIYSEEGYAFADISPLTDIKPEEKKVNLTFSIEKGEKTYLEKIKITGNTRTRDNVIRRELRLTEGAIYNSKELDRSKQEVNNLGFFEEVKFNTEPGGAANKVNLNVEVKERPTGSFSIGAGYSSADSIMGMFQISQNNFRGKGQQLSLMANIGGKSSRYDISFTEPWWRGTRTSVGFDLYNTGREYEDFERASKGINLREGFPIARFDYTRLNLSYRFEQLDIKNVDDDVALEIQKQEGSSTTGSFTANIVRDSRDDRFNTRKGSFLSFSTEFAGIAGENKFMGLIGSAAKYFPMRWDTAFMIRGTMGYLFGYGGMDVPISDKFFLGGLDSMRGFEARTVGPREKRPEKKNKFYKENGKWHYDNNYDTNHHNNDDYYYEEDTTYHNHNDYDVIGGDKEMFFNFEYIFPIMKEAGIRGVVFADIGNAYKQGEGFFSDLRYDVGVGVRWYSPFGPLRVEWGINLDPNSKYDEKTSNFEFSMGQTF
ncbi:MAG: outer membrane protein assembly factor BamA [Proteobacteria bacterium]|nr:outer membrane protein assembly factor BamA [Pseudomonadota bacterium]